MGRGTTWQSAVVASLSVSGAFLGAAAPIPEVPHGQFADEVVALTTGHEYVWTERERSAEATGDVPVELDLRVIAHASLDGAELERTSETVQKLLAAAGVLSRWRDCSGAGCSANLGSVAIDVLLLPMTKLTERDVYGEVAHDAITGAPTVLIYVPPIADRVRAIRSSIDGRSNPALATMQTGHLVGAAIAHEVGHALGLRHGARGVMKGRLTFDDALALRTSRLLFTSSEGATMRATLRTARNSVAVAAR